MKKITFPLISLILLTFILTGCLPKSQNKEKKTTPESTIKTDEQLIREALAKKSNIPLKDFKEVEIVIEENDNQFASGTAGTAGGGHWFAAKVNSEWEIAWSGQGFIPCEDIEPYNFPKTMISQCYDAKTDDFIKR